MLASLWRRPAQPASVSELLNYQPDVDWGGILGVASISCASLFLKGEGGEGEESEGEEAAAATTASPTARGGANKGLRLSSVYEESTRLHVICMLAWYLGARKRCHFTRPTSEISDKEETKAARELLGGLCEAFEGSGRREKRSASPETTTSASGTFTVGGGGGGSQSSSPSLTHGGVKATISDPTITMKSYGRFPNDEVLQEILSRHHVYAWILVLFSLLKCTRVVPLPVQLRLMEHYEAVSMTSSNSVSSMSTSSSRNLGGGGGGNTSSDDVPERRRRPSGGDLALIMSNNHNEALVAILAHVPKLNFLALGSVCGLLAREKSKNRARTMNILGPALLMNRGEGSPVVSFRQMSVAAIALGNMVANAEALFEEEVGGEFFFEDAREEVRAHYTSPGAFSPVFGRRIAAASSGGGSTSGNNSSSPRRRGEGGEGVGKRRASAGALLTRLGNLSLNVVTSSTLTSSRNDDEELAVPRQSQQSQLASQQQQQARNNKGSDLPPRQIGDEQHETGRKGASPPLPSAMGKLRSMLSLVSGSSSRGNTAGESALASDYNVNNAIPKRGGSFGLF